MSTTSFISFSSTGQDLQAVSKNEHSGRLAAEENGDTKWLDRYHKELDKQQAIPQYDLFSGIHAFFSTGTETLSSFHLQKIFHLYGGTPHRFFAKGQLTYWFTDRVCYAREKALHNSKVVAIDPSWVMKCVDAKKLVPIDQFIVTTPKETNSITKFFKKKPAQRDDH
ncbi:hypothetical protein BLNAU_5744 [Blattamonas nauphoetae]|uniref:BRCT domain-containing protein n=1 Tax=Blattamonas nauphoetae TaxID=2049346 RepID=A0ABQ9Y606_9EUKA|nr:hypothetical protein BLNAU_5744 [Blattamonas nauphoetae]